MSIKNILALALVAPLFFACGKKEAAEEPAAPDKAEEAADAADEGAEAADEGGEAMDEGGEEAAPADGEGDAAAE